METRHIIMTVAAVAAMIGLALLAAYYPINRAGDTLLVNKPPVVQKDR